MYTLELGIITAGFLFMCFLTFGTLIFGRFFCSWACHIMVLQDLCAWLLRKLGLQRKPIRSRLLLLVPPLTAFYMFIWPQILRGWHSRTFPTFHWATDVEGWASLVTSNFWRNLPNGPIIAFTFLVCGFIIVYLLGTRTFCTYVCPYGAIFALVDRFSPVKIKVSDKCQQCGTCTAACTSGVPVHHEVRQHGMIVNPACLKDLDCVSACPQRALRLTVSKPALFKSWQSGGRFAGLPYDFKLREELLIAVVFIITLLTFRGLYSRVPFLLSLALGGIFAYLTVVTMRLFGSADVALATVRLKHAGGLTPSGRAFGVVAVLLAALVGHSVFVRYHEYSGLRQIRTVHGLASTEPADDLARTAYAHLLTADRWGLIRNPKVERGMLALSSRMLDLAAVEEYARRLLDRYPDDGAVQVQLGQCLMKQDRLTEAESHFRAAVAGSGGQSQQAAPVLIAAHQAQAGIALRRRDYATAAEELNATLALDPRQAALHAQLGGVLAELGRLEEARESLTEATRLDPNLAAAEYNLGVVLGHLGRFGQAIPHYRRALTMTPDDADLHNNLGFALLQTGDLEPARQHLERSVVLAPANAVAHFNLGQLFAALKQSDRAGQYFRNAARLDPRYARPRDGAQPEQRGSTQ